MFEDLLYDGNEYKSLMQIIHYIIPRVIRNNFKDEDGNIIKNKYGYFKNSIESNIRKLELLDEDLWNEDELMDLYDRVC